MGNGKTRGNTRASGNERWMVGIIGGRRELSLRVGKLGALRGGNGETGRRIMVGRENGGG